MKKIIVLNLLIFDKKNSMNIKKFFLTLLLFLLFASTSVFSETSIKPIKIGGIFCLTGEIASGCRESVKQSLLAIKNFPGAGGSVTFSNEGSWRMPLNVFKVIDTKFVKIN